MDKQRNRRRIIAMALSLLLAMAVAILLLPTPEESVLVAAHNLSRGHILQASDITLASLPAGDIPSDAIRSMEEAVGQTISIDRIAGDILRVSSIGESIRLQPNERALAVTVNNASGLAGLLTPGDRVGVTAIIQTSGSNNNASFAKMTVENLRVIYISPEFEAQDTIDPTVLATEQATDPNVLMYSLSQERSDEGVVVLAVPIEQISIIYDFALIDPEIPSHEEIITIVELLALLDADQSAKLSLYLMPEDPEAFVSAGIYLPDLVVTPGPTPTQVCDPATDKGCLLSTPISATQEVFETVLTPSPTQENDENE